MIIENEHGVNLLTPINSLDEIVDEELIYIERETCDDIVIEIGYKKENKLYSKNGKRVIKDYVYIYKKETEVQRVK